jgi:predicted RNase H-like HicB family nuclease
LRRERLSNHPLERTLKAKQQYYVTKSQELVVCTFYIIYGDILDEAIEKAKEAIELYIESLKAHGEEMLLR